jgi:hypothetical protein
MYWCRRYTRHIQIQNIFVYRAKGISWNQQLSPPLPLQCLAVYELVSEFVQTFTLPTRCTICGGSFGTNPFHAAVRLS